MNSQVTKIKFQLKEEIEELLTLVPPAHIINMILVAYEDSPDIYIVLMKRL